MKNFFVLRRARDRERSNRAISVSYCDKSSWHLRRIEEKRCANGRRKYAKFYHEGKSFVVGERDWMKK